MMQSTQQLAALIDRKHGVLVQLRALGDTQTDLVASGDTAALLKLLAVKQQLIAMLQEVEHKLKPYYAGDPEQRAWPSPAERTRCANQANECNTLLEQIVRLEKLGAETMSQRKNEVAQQLQQVHAAAQVRSAYQAQQRGHA